MEGTEAIQIARDAIWLLIKIAAPVMLVSLLVGLTIALFQALTQIQEMTLTFVPKIIAIFLTLIISLPWMAENLHEFHLQMAEKIALADDDDFAGP